MSNALIKLAPLAGFLAAVGSCIWPFVAPAPRLDAPEPRLPNVEPALLSPSFGPPSARDPFLRPGESRSAPPPQAAVAAGASAPAPAGADPAGAGPAPAFSLGATLVAGERRAAIIDGRVYRPGEPLESGPGGPAPGWTVARIEPGRVLLARPGLASPLALELPDRSAALLAGVASPGAGAAGGAPLGFDLGPPPFSLADARAALAAAGVRLPAVGLLERLAARAGGGGPYRALLGLTGAPAAPPPGPPAGSPLVASGEVAR